MSKIASTTILLILISLNQGHSATDIDEFINEPAPEWGELQWINSEPLQLKELEDNVLLIRWWTDTCPFCERSANALNELHQTFEDQGLVIIGMYHPKPRRPRREKDIVSVAKRLGFVFPIALDMDWSILRRYWLVPGTRRWTSVSFLVDKGGKIRYIHPGGEYHKDGGKKHRACQEALQELKRQIGICLAELGKKKTEDKKKVK